ncbi:MAG: 50S ribosomal protein L3 [Methanobacteriaceae archaeon]|jgi:large subunit ribosomal protein L3|nr:50S ribosomal protein L3 [Methanobacteriaceae archaeon]
MARHHQPRKGSVAFSPRKRSAKETPRIKSWPMANEAKLLGLAGYKVGMTHVMMVDNTKNSPTEGMEISTPVTILEVPPICVMGIRAYENTSRGLKAMGDVLADNLNEELSRKISLPKEYKKEAAIEKMKENLEHVAEIRVLVNTNPKVTSVPKKKPEIFECGVGGKTPEEQLNFAIDLLGKEVSAKEIMDDGEFVDSIAVTKGKGFQGPVKRWGIRIQYGKAARSSKARHVGSIGPWTPSRTMWTVAQAGQMGYHKRTEYNKKILKIGEASEAEAVNPKGGFVKYGLVKNDYIIIKGSVPGPSKRLIILRKAIRSNGKNTDAPQINYISTASKQGV